MSAYTGPGGTSKAGPPPNTPGAVIPRAGAPPAPQGYPSAVQGYGGYAPAAQGYGGAVQGYGAAVHGYGGAVQGYGAYGAVQGYGGAIQGQGGYPGNMYQLQQGTACWPFGMAGIQQGMGSVNNFMNISHNICNCKCLNKGEGGYTGGKSQIQQRTAGFNNFMNISHNACKCKFQNSTTSSSDTSTEIGNNNEGGHARSVQSQVQQGMGGVNNFMNISHNICHCTCQKSCCT